MGAVQKRSICYISFVLYGDYVIMPSSSSFIEVNKIVRTVSMPENDVYSKFRVNIMQLL